jgi:2-polyprenyl-3-methyl-5-hydroxy-6-metoxy-1,4-benzoquinol methylase
MYEPFIEEVKSYPISPDIKYNFYAKTFDNTTQKYDIVILSEALHHITNPDIIME